MGYSIKAACEALKLPRSSYYASLQRNPTPRGVKGHKDDRGNDGIAGDDRLLEEIKAIKANHPFWGYRRVTAYLRHRRGMKVNHKKVYTLMRENDLTVSKETRKRPERPLRSKPKANKPREYWGQSDQVHDKFSWLGVFSHSA